MVDKKSQPPNLITSLYNVHISTVLRAQRTRRGWQLGSPRFAVGILMLSALVPYTTIFALANWQSRYYFRLSVDCQ